MYYYPSLGWVTQYLFGRRLGGPERNLKFEVRSLTSAACCVPDDCFFLLSAANEHSISRHGMPSKVNLNFWLTEQ
jgi:hypothetical protein